MVQYEGKRLLLTVAHVTNVHAATCIVVDDKPVKNTTPMYSVGAMNYLEGWNMDQFKEQQAKFLDDRIPKEDKDYGLVDLSYVLVKPEVLLKQRRIDFNGLVVEEGDKLDVQVSLKERPSKDAQYAFCGRVRGEFITGGVDQLASTETLRHGLRFIAKRGYYYEFELPKEIEDNLDYRGTSGAPIMDEHGKVVSLITHGYPGGRSIFGIALADFKSSIDAYILTEGK